jgi:ribonuclease D
LIDLARRRPKSVQQALHTRDLNRPEYRKRLDQVIKLLSAVNDIPDDQLAPRLRSRRDDVSSDEQVIAKLLALALANRCAELEVAQPLVGTNRDLNELVRRVRGGDRDADPILLSGWRNDMCGSLLKNVLSGRIGFRVSPPGSSTPLVFDETPP